MTIVDADTAASRVHRSPKSKLNGHGAAQHALDLVVGIARQVEVQLHIEMPVKYLRRNFIKHHPTAYTDADLRSWVPHLYHRRDPQLDFLVIQFALATAARKDALCNVRLQNLDIPNCRASFDGKGKPPYWVPVHRSLLVAVARLAAERGAVHRMDHAFQRLPARDGQLRPLTRTYFEALWKFLDNRVTSAESLHTHRLRHTTAEYLETAGGGSELATRFLNHSPTGGLATTYNYYDQQGMSDVVFLRRANAALGPFDDCPIPPSGAPDIPSVTVLPRHRAESP